MSALSPRSVEQWLDEQPVSTLREKEKEFPEMTMPLPAASRSRVGAFREVGFQDYKDYKEDTPGPLHNFSRPNTSNYNNYNTYANLSKNNNSSRPPPPLLSQPVTQPERDLHVHSRLQMHSRFSKRHEHQGDAEHDHDHDFVDPVECFLRVCSACLGSAALAVGAVTYVLIHRNSESPTGGSPLDNRLAWVVAVPVSAAALLWQLARLSLLAWWGRRTTSLLTIDLVAEAVLAVGSIICSILAGFQAARHAAYNKRHHGEGRLYQDVGPEIALVVLLAFLSFSTFGILALNVVEANRRRRQHKSNSSNRSTSSSVIEIIQR